MVKTVALNGRAVYYTQRGLVQETETKGLVQGRFLGNIFRNITISMLTM